MATHAPHNPAANLLEARPACGRETRNGFVFFARPGERPTCRRCAVLVDERRAAAVPDTTETHHDGQ